MDRRTFLCGAATAVAQCVINVPPAEAGENTDRIAIDHVPAGRTISRDWQGRTVLIRRRTAREIAAANASDGGMSPAPDATRVVDPEWLVVDAACTHRGCRVWPMQTVQTAFRCFCHGSAFDISGRVTRGPAKRNLEVPVHRFETHASALYLVLELRPEP